VAHALVRAASAFLAALGRRPLETAPVQAPTAPRTVVSLRRTVAGIENKCPVCQARFRSTRICSRCGADLEPLMRLAVKAWQLRQASRQALDAGDIQRSHSLATEAQGAQYTGSGEALRLLGAWLKTPSATTVPTPYP
jgi:predicted amidophosphoribosyltransferase